MELNLQTKKFGELKYYIDDEDYKLIENHKIYASKLNNNKIYLIRDDKQWLHRLILPNCPKKMVVDHINGKTLDNRKSNLRITTRKINKQNTNKTRFTENDIIDILASPLSNKKLAKQYNVSDCLISNIRTGVAYDHFATSVLRHKQSQQGKLSEFDVSYILTSNLCNLELSQMFGLNKKTIYYIKIGKMYKNCCPEIPRKKTKSYLFNN